MKNIQTDRKVYTGIGSRDITVTEESYISYLSDELCAKGWTVVSGNANGVDIAFQRHVPHIAVLPWPKFNYKAFTPDKVWVLSEDDTEALDSVKTYYPTPERLSQGAYKLMARNYRQVVGRTQNTKFVLYCSDHNSKGQIKGGTAQAVKLAKDKGILTVNIRYVIGIAYPKQLANLVVSDYKTPNNFLYQLKTL